MISNENFVDEKTTILLWGYSSRATWKNIDQSQRQLRTKEGDIFS